VHVVIAASAACGGATTQTAPASPTTAEATTPSRPVSIVSSSVIVGSCPDAQKMNSKQAAKEIEELLGPCSKVPGGAAHFSATLMPNGQVELASPSGDPSAGLVPTCLVQNTNQLRHKVKLASPCKFDVNLEERRAGGAAQP
jgi:hypothetical protein